MARTHPQRSELLWHLGELHNMTCVLTIPPLPPPAPQPSSWEFGDWQRLGLLAKGMTHRMTKLLCLSVRLGLYPTDICWLRLIQAPEKPGIRVRNTWLFFPSLPFVILFLAKKKNRTEEEGEEKTDFKSLSCFF